MEGGKENEKGGKANGILMYIYAFYVDLSRREIGSRREKRLPIFRLWHSLDTLLEKREEPFACHGQAMFLFIAHGDYTGNRGIGGADDDIIMGAAKGKIRQNAYP